MGPVLSRFFLHNSAFRGAARRLLMVVTLAALNPAMQAIELSNARPTLRRFKHDIAATVRADHPAILPVAAAIRAVTTSPIEQLSMVNDVTHLLVDFDDDRRVYGRADYHATLDEMLALRREKGWLYLRDDCDGRAVFAAHLLASLGIKWRLEASYWKQHAWVVATVDGIDYDLLDFQPEGAPTHRLSYRLIGRWVTHAPRHPPLFQWRQQWALRTHCDIAVGLRLGLLTLDSTTASWHERRSMDWTKISPPDQALPADPRMIASNTAGFPYGEHLGASALAATPPAAPAVADEKKIAAAPEKQP